MNYVMCNSYPRSGKQWTHLRVRLFFSRCIYPDLKIHDIKLNKKIEDKHVRFNHLGFNNSTEEKPPVAGFFTYLLSHTPPNAYFIIRNACAVLSSVYFHTRMYWPAGAAMSIDKYTTSNRGVERYCAFLNAINDHFLSARKCKFVYYEDMFSLEWIKKNIPSIANMPQYELSDSDAKHIYLESSIARIARKQYGNLPYKKAINKLLNPITAEGIRCGTINSYKEILKPETIDYINNYLKEHCRLKQYITYYFAE